MWTCKSISLIGFAFRSIIHWCSLDPRDKHEFLRQIKCLNLILESKTMDSIEWYGVRLLPTLFLTFKFVQVLDVKMFIIRHFLMIWEWKPYSDGSGRLASGSKPLSQRFSDWSRARNVNEKWAELLQIFIGGSFWLHGLLRACQGFRGVTFGGIVSSLDSCPDRIDQLELRSFLREPEMDNLRNVFVIGANWVRLLFDHRLK
jgi:hypothetical protein